MSARRNLLASTSTSLLPGADAELIAICAAFCELEREYDKYVHEFEDGSPEAIAADREHQKIIAEQNDLVDRMCALPCTTLPGVQAMARALAAWDRELLKNGPASDVGDIIMSNLVERLLALRVPTKGIDDGVSQAADWVLSIRRSDQHPDADLLAVCADFRASDAKLDHVCDAEPELSDEERDALIVPICESWDVMLDRMARLRATTSDGLAARALALAQHSGVKPGCKNYAFEFNPNDRESVTGRLLHMLLSDAVQMCGTPQMNPDADLLALRPEFDRLHALMVDYNNDLIPDGETECADFDALCNRIATTAPAVTAEGRAFQAAAAMHHLYYRLNDEQQARNPAWLMLKGIAGDAYRSVEARV